MTQATRGVLALVVCCTVWGLSPLYYKMLEDVPPLEILAHRTLWSALFFAGLLVAQKRLGAVRQGFCDRVAALRTTAAAVTISANWFLFILSVQIGHTTEASLGYYMFPLVAVLLGAAVLGEQLSRSQWVSVGLAALGVAVLTLGLGVAPWISLLIAGTFGIYGLIKKRVLAGPVVSVTAEVLVLLPLALAWLAWTHASAGAAGAAGEAGRGGAFGTSLATSALLAFSGPLTAVPLMLFSYAGKRVRLTTIGLVQYLNPTFQFLCAVVIFVEPFGPWHMAAFSLIWAGLALYTLSALGQDRAARRSAMRAVTPPETPMNPFSEPSAKP